MRHHHLLRLLQWQGLSVAVAPLLALAILLAWRSWDVDSAKYSGTPELIVVAVLAALLGLALQQLQSPGKRTAQIEHRFRATVESAPMAMVMVDSEGTIVMANAEAERLFGYQQGELLARSVEILVPMRFRHDHPDLRKGFFLNPEARRMGGGRDLFGLRKDGTEFPVEIGLNPVETDEGLFVLSAIVDLTERKRLEQRFRATIESAPTAMVMIDSNGTIVLANAETEKLFGYPRDELLMEPVEILVPKRFRQNHPALRIGYFENPQARQMGAGRDLYGLRKDGTEFPVEIGLNPVETDEGIFVLSAIVDITARKRLEQRFRTTIESAPTAMVMVDSNGTIVLANAETEKLFGYARGELLSQQVELLVPTRFRDRHPELRTGYLRDPKARSMGAGRELYALRKDGTEFPVEIGLNPVETDEGLFVLSAILDITDRKQAETELRSLNETLEQRVAEQTRELRSALKSLLKAKEAAEAASHAKSAFLANMSHEIRTPLNAIIGMTELVLDTELRSEQRDYITMVRESSDSLLTVINDILDFSKIEAGRLDLEEVSFDHSELLGDTMKSLGLRAHHRGLELLCRIVPTVPRMLIGDPGRLRQVLVNLIGNAVKFTESGEVGVEVQIQESDENSVVLHYTVRDTGIGISPEKLQKMFEAFEQADTSTTRRFGGTGLGLAIASRLVEMMGGKIRAESQEGVGSTFHFTARFVVLPDQPPLPVELESLQGLQALVVDDNATNREIVCELLAKIGVVPLVANSAPQALEIMRERDEGQPIALLVVDAHMPDTDGFEFIHQIRQEFQLSGMSILMLSSGDRPRDIARCKELDAAYLIKPIKESELWDAILLALGKTPIQSVDSADKSVPCLRPLRILLAEDSFVNQKLAMGLLAGSGHQIDIAKNGHEAIQLWKRNSYDLVLMDVQMPEVDGLEATKAIRDEEALRDGRTPIIAITAYAMKGDREQCLEAGMDDYVSKPIRRQELFETIERVLTSANAPQIKPALRDEAIEGVVQWPVALETVNGDEELLRDLAAASLREMSDLINELRAGIRDGDPAKLKYASHSLKNQFRIFGAATGEHLAFHIENTARDGRVDVHGVADQLERIHQAMQKELREFLLQTR